MANKLTGAALDARAKQLGIDEDLSADEKRAEIDKIEAVQAEGVANAEPPTVEAPADEAIYLQNILDRPRLVGRGIRRFQVAGAYHGVDPETQITLQEAATRIHEWENAEVAEVAEAV